jgi:hypothetical protein
MTDIHFFGHEYKGTAEGDHGVFTDRDGPVYVGKVANLKVVKQVEGSSTGPRNVGFACVGVGTWTNGYTAFVECDADGKPHGRDLGCTAGGDTRYNLFEHGSYKEDAVLRADGTCTYNGKACPADYAPFVALQTKVLPIKARPR